MKVQTMSVQQLSSAEIDGVGGGALSVDTAILATVGLMACAPLSVAVIAAGTVGLLFYAVAKSTTNMDL